jgi:hypothetical protein
VDDDFSVSGIIDAFRNPRKPDKSTIAWAIGGAVGVVAVVFISLAIVNSAAIGI